MDQRQLFPRDILSVLFKHKGLIVTFLVLVVGVVFLGNYVWPPTYESTAKLRIMRGREVSQTDPTVIRSSAGLAMIQMTVEDVNSEIELIYSHDVLRRVVEALSLDEGMPQAGGVLHRAFRTARGALRTVQYALALKSRPSAVDEAVEVLREAVTVEPVKNSHVLEITCRLGDAQFAHDVLAAVIEAYIEQHVEVFRSRESSPFFEAQMGRVKAELARSQGQLDAFRNEHKLLSLEVEKTLILQQYTEAKKLLIQLAESESAAEAVATGAGGDSAIIATLSRATDNTVVTEMQLRLLELLLDRNRIVQSLGPKHPEVQAVNREIANVQARMREAVAATRTVTEAKIAELEQRLVNLNDLAARLEELEREVKVHAAAYEYYAQKLEESRVADALAENNISNVKVISSPDLPTDPVRPRKLFNLVLALIAGIVGGVALAFLLEYLDHGLKTPEDVEHYLAVPPLASFFRDGDTLDPAEAQRMASLLDAAQSDRPLKVIQVHSSVAGEGAERVARALAETYAENPLARVLEIDLASEGGGRGLLDVVLGDVSVQDVLSGEVGLQVLGRGASGECPAYLWGSERMRMVLADLRQQFDRIILHVPPVLRSTDALNVIRASDGAVMVIRADHTRREVVRRAIDTIADAQGRMLGAVLTDRTQPIPQAVYRRI